jgi:hypothetical protein
MTFHEEMQMRVKCAELWKAGKEEESMQLAKTIPLSPWMAEWYKKYAGVEYLRNSGWNLSAAEAEYGANWLTR